MVTEKKAEVVDETTQAEEIKPTVEQLNEVIAKLTSDVETAKREAKSHQDYGRKTKEELDRQRGLDDKVSALAESQKVVAEMLADLIDRNADEDEEPQPKKRRSAAYLDRLQVTQAQEQKQTTQRVREMALEADRLLKSVGLEMRKSPETLEAYALFTEGSPEAGLEEVKKIVESKKTEAQKTKETPEQIAEQLAEKKFQQMLKDRGLDKVDTGIPTGGSGSWEEFQEKFIKNEISIKEYEERALREGKLL